MTTTTLAPQHRPEPAAAAAGRDRAIILSAATLCGLIAFAALHRLALGELLLPAGINPWLVVHLAAVLPALPLGAYVLVRRKGDRLHRLLGRVWVMLMLLTALSSFGLRGMTGGFSWIHLLSILTLVSVPRSVVMAMRGNIRAHMRGMRIVYAALVAAGAFAFLPGRLLGAWLFG